MDSNNKYNNTRLFSDEIESELEISKENYKIIVENINDLVVIIDDQGRILYASPNYCKLFNEKLDNLIGKKYIYLVHEDDREKTEKAVEQLNIPPHTCYVEQRAWTNFGWRWLAWSDRAIIDQDGNISEIIGVGRDITKRRRMEEALKRSELDYKGLFENAMSAIIIFEPKDEIILDANIKACELYGFEKEEFIGMSLQRISKDVSKGRKEIDNTFNKMHNHKFETIHHNKNREELAIEVSASVVKFADRDAILSINNDISKIKAIAKKLDEVNALCDQMLEFSNEAAIIIDDEYRIIRSNSKALDLFAYEKQDANELNFAELLNGELKSIMKKLFALDLSENIELSMRKSDSSHFKAFVSVQKIDLNESELFYILINELN